MLQCVSSVGLSKLCGSVPATIQRLGNRISGANWQPGAVTATYNISRPTDKTGLSDIISERNHRPHIWRVLYVPDNY